MTNDPAETVAFLNRVGPAIYKPLHQTGITDRDTHRVVYTTPITITDIDNSIRHTAHLFQARVEKRYEVRLTVVDGTFLAARIDATTDATLIDWRADYAALRHTPLANVPAAVRHGVTALMSRLRLRFGALDFIVSPDGRWWFLEINPNGQWAWIEDATGLPITSAIADALTREDL